MDHETPPICARDPRHQVYRLAPLPAQVLTVENGQGRAVRRLLDAEPPPWWCDGCGWPVDDNGR